MGRSCRSSLGLVFPKIPVSSNKVVLLQSKNFVSLSSLPVSSDLQDQRGKTTVKANTGAAGLRPPSTTPLVNVDPVQVPEPLCLNVRMMIHFYFCFRASSKKQQSTKRPAVLLQSLPAQEAEQHGAAHPAPSTEPASLWTPATSEPRHGLHERPGSGCCRVRPIARLTSGTSEI